MLRALNIYSQRAKYNLYYLFAIKDVLLINSSLPTIILLTYLEANKEVLSQATEDVEKLDYKG